MLCRWNQYRAPVLVAILVAAAVFRIGAVRAEPYTGGIAISENDRKAPVTAGTPLARVDFADRSGKSWPASMTDGVSGPPADKGSTNTITGLTSAAIIKPIKYRKFALALAAATSASRKAFPFGTGSSAFKWSHPKNHTISFNETMHWVVLTGTLPNANESDFHNITKTGSSETLFDDASWRYSVEMVFIPMSSVALHAALTLNPGEEAFDAGEPSGVLEKSLIGVSVGLDFRPMDGVLFDVDYARVMNVGDAFRTPGITVVADPGRDERRGAGDDLILVSLSIQF